MDDFKLVIDGRLVEGGRRTPVLNPATEEPVAQCPRADVAQLNEAVAAAKRAFPVWSATPRSERSAGLHAIASAMEARFQEFVALLTQEQGKPTDQASYEIGGSIGFLRYFAALDLPDKILREDDSVRIVEQRYPLGVVAAITPWNFPILLLMMKVGPALISGNTMVIKPAPTTPLTTLLFGKICATQLPAGVVNVIVDENDLGGLLTQHPDIAKVAFTGSTATGKKVAAAASDTLKRMTLELGGNDAAIVLDDADPKVVANGIFNGATLNAGQVCLAIKRVYCAENIYDALCDELAELARAAVVDDGAKQGTQIGPIQNRQQYEKILELIEDARLNGNVIAGGDRVEGPGYFIRPTIVRDIANDTRLVQEEQFGPVLPVMKYADLDEAIANTNDSVFGLGGTVWSSDLERAAKVASQIQSGVVWVNKHLDLPFDVPFGGAKQSGIGAENGVEGLEEYSQRRIVNIGKDLVT
ncbi:aldehyde dehydrogenase family protein [Croceicoccus bisphenolivorans]|uniref:aldehyde dehydrogenase family protein n=1 Tax=Croceicoccus bisphenolivorans TaxID=1783232 RepID=UPI000837987D|nr:aldehyde dehydrogenase family protein [Croceicoccus bisphenolivorans]